MIPKSQQIFLRKETKVRKENTKLRFVISFRTVTVGSELIASLLMINRNLGKGLITKSHLKLRSVRIFIEMDFVGTLNGVSTFILPRIEFSQMLLKG